MRVKHQERSNDGDKRCRLSDKEYPHLDVVVVGLEDADA